MKKNETQACFHNNGEKNQLKASLSVSTIECSNTGESGENRLKKTAVYLSARLTIRSFKKY